MASCIIWKGKMDPCQAISTVSPAPTTVPLDRRAREEQGREE